MRKLALLICILAVSGVSIAQGTSPAVSIGGSIGVTGGQSLTGQTFITMTDANYTMVPNEWWVGTLIITSSTPLTTTRNLIAPANAGQHYCIENETTGANSVQIIAPTGTGVIIPQFTGTATCVVFNGTNYFAAGGTGSAASPSGSIQYNNSGAFGGSSNGTLDSSGNLNALGQLGVGLSRANTSHVVDSSGSSNSTTLNGVNPVELRVANTDTTANNYEGVAVAMTNSTPAVVTAGKITAVNTSHTAGSESADWHFLNRNAGTVTDYWQMLHTGGMTSTSVTGGDKGAGTINMAGCYVNGSGCNGNVLTSLTTTDCTSTPQTLLITSSITLSTTATITKCTILFQGAGTITGAGTLACVQCSVVSQTGGTLFGASLTVSGLTGLVPVEWFGAVGFTTKSAASSGSDYTTQIQHALNSIRSGQAYLQALYYQASSGLSITTSGIGIRGLTGRDSYPANAAVSSIVSNSATVNILTVKGTSFAQPGFLNWNTFEDFSVERLTQPSGTVPTQAVGIYLQYLQGVKFIKVASNDSFDGFYLNGTTTAGWGIFNFINCSNGLLTVNSYTAGQNLNCMDLDSTNGIPLNSMYFDKVSGGTYNTAFASGVTSRVFYIHGTTINDLDLLYPGGAQISYGIDIEYTGSGAADSEADIHIVQPIFDSVTTSAIKVNGLSAIGGQPTVTIEGGYFLTNNNGLKVIDCESSAGVSILGNQFLTIGPSSDTGIFGAGCTNSIVANNKAQGFDNGTFLNFTASSNNNSILGNNILGVVASPMANGFVFDGTSLTNDYGINTIGANVTNPLTGNPTGKVVVIGAANTFTANQAISLSGSVAQWSVFNSLSTGVAQFTALNDASVGMTYAINGSAGAVFGVIGANDGYMLSASNLDLLTVTSGGVIKFGTNTAGAERMRIAANGGVTVGDSTFGGTSPGAGVLAAQNGAKFGTTGQATISSAGATAVPSIAINGGTAITAQSGTGGTVAMTASPTFTGTPQAPTASLGTSTTQIATTGFVTTTLQGSPATPGAGSGVTSVTCLDASDASITCTSTRGSLKIVGGTATTGTIATLAWSAESTARVCVVLINGNGSTGTSGFDIGHTAPSTTGFSITSGLSVLGATIYLDYHCSI